MKNFLFLCLIQMILIYSFSLDAVIVARAVEIHLTIEDGDMHQAAITGVKFNCEELDISKKSFMNRKITKLIKVSPGQYPIEWTTEKSEKPWGGKKEIKTHHRMVIFEVTDAVVYINIRGEHLTTY